MEVTGNIKLLKSEIQKEFAARLKELEQELVSTFNAEKQTIGETHKKEINRVKEEIKKGEEMIFKATLSDAKLAAKKDFEKKREEIINLVFGKAKEEINQKLLSKEYIGMIKNYIDGKSNVELIGSSLEYKKYFPDIKISERIGGIIILDKNSVIDFTYKSFMETKKSELRLKISGVLFGDAN